MAHTLAFHLMRTSRKLQNAIGFKSSGLDLSPSEASALLIIDSQKDTSQIEIALKLHLKPASVVSLIDKLENHNLVSRKPFAKDRRRYDIELTQKGRQQVKIIRDQASKLEGFVKKALTKNEVNTLFTALEKISTLMESWPTEIYKELPIRKEVKNELPSAKRHVAS